MLGRHSNASVSVQMLSRCVRDIWQDRFVISWIWDQLNWDFMCREVALSLATTSFVPSASSVLHAYDSGSYHDNCNDHGITSARLWNKHLTMVFSAHITFVQLPCTPFGDFWHNILILQDSLESTPPYVFMNSSICVCISFVQVQRQNHKHRAATQRSVA